MRYCTWQLDWPTPEFGFGPESVVAESGSSIESSSWVLGNDLTGTVLGYLHGEFVIPNDNAWNLTELNKDQALAFAQQLEETAFIDEDGFILSSQPKPFGTLHLNQDSSSSDG